MGLLDKIADWINETADKSNSSETYNIIFTLFMTILLISTLPIILWYKTIRFRFQTSTPKIDRVMGRIIMVICSSVASLFYLFVYAAIFIKVFM